MTTFKSSLSFTILGIFLAFVLTWFGAGEIFSPAEWTSYVPSFISAGSFVNVLVTIHGLVLIICALGLALNIGRQACAILATIMLAEVCVSLTIDSGINAVVVRDIGLFGMALAIAFADFTYTKKSSRMTTEGAEGIFPQEYK